MALQTPHGNLSGPAMSVRDMMAGSAQWQEWCDVGTADLAKPFIKIGRAPLWAMKNRDVLAVVASVAPTKWVSSSAGDGTDFYSDSGRVYVMLRRNIPSEFLTDDKEQAQADSDLYGEAWMDFCGYTDDDEVNHGLQALIDQLLDATGQEGALVIRDITITEGPGFSPEEARGGFKEFIGCTLELNWGIN